MGRLVSLQYSPFNIFSFAETTGEGNISGSGETTSSRTVLLSGRPRRNWVLPERYVGEIAAEIEKIRVVCFQRLKEERNAYLHKVLDELGVEEGDRCP